MVLRFGLWLWDLNDLGWVFGIRGSWCSSFCGLVTYSSLEDAGFDVKAWSVVTVAVAGSEAPYRTQE